MSGENINSSNEKYKKGFTAHPIYSGFLFPAANIDELNEKVLTGGGKFVDNFFNQSKKGVLLKEKGSFLFSERAFLNFERPFAI